MEMVYAYRSTTCYAHDWSYIINNQIIREATPHEPTINFNLLKPNGKIDGQINQ